MVSRLSTYRYGSFNEDTGLFSAPPTVVQSFEYDLNARLTRETRTKLGATTHTRYAYDAVGNRTTKTVTTPSGQERTDYTYDVVDRLTTERITPSVGPARTIAYTWDGNGNLASKSEPGKATIYRFNPQNRLIDIRVGANLLEAQGSVPLARYAYDSQGNRIRKTTPTSHTSYLIDVTATYPQVAVEMREGVTTAYVRGYQLIRHQVLRPSGSEELLPLHGHLGTSIGAISNGQVVEEIDADAFGNMDRTSGLKQTHLYTGEYWDEDAQLLYLRARWYDPRVGRFISPDPHAGNPTDPRTLNRYAYAGSDPVNNTDPTGEYTLSELNAAMQEIGRASTRASAAFAQGAVRAGWQFASRSGRLAEEWVEKIVTQCLKPKKLKSNVVIDKTASKNQLDLIALVEKDLLNIEVKNKLPAVGSPAMARLREQLATSSNAGKKVAVVGGDKVSNYRLREAMEYFKKAGVNTENVIMINGLVSFVVWLGEVYAEECLGL